MKRKQPYIKGQTMGNNGIVFISEMETVDTIRYAKFKCHCGKIFKTRISSVKLNCTTSCGCISMELTRKANIKHGMQNTPTYRIWDHIKERIRNPNGTHYRYYGGRGITMFPLWQVDFQLFYDYVSALPHYGEEGMTLDRINNDGNYEPCNLRWVTQHIQATNKRILNPSSSGYTGVYPRGDEWYSVLKIMNKVIQLGRYHTKEQAVTARNNYIIEHNLVEYKIQPIKT